MSSSSRISISLKSVTRPYSFLPGRRAGLVLLGLCGLARVSPFAGQTRLPALPTVSGGEGPSPAWRLGGLRRLSTRAQGCFRVPRRVHGQWACYQGRRGWAAGRHGQVGPEPSPRGQGRLSDLPREQRTASRPAAGPWSCAPPAPRSLPRGPRGSRCRPRAAAELFLRKDEARGPPAAPPDSRGSPETAATPGLRGGGPRLPLALWEAGVCCAASPHPVGVFLSISYSILPTPQEVSVNLPHLET